MAGSYGCAVVTGAARGIGRSIALHLARAGLDVVANDVVADAENSDSGVYEVKRLIEQEGRRCVVVQGDVSCRDDHARLVDTAVAEFGGIDVLVNNAGIAPSVRRDILETDEGSYDLVMAVNARGPFFLTQRVASQMVHQVEQGRQPPPVIVFITSISAAASSPNRAEYCISKAALSAVARLFAHRLAEHNISVFEVRPGIIATDMTAAVSGKYDQMIADGLLPQARWGTPDDVGRVVAVLASGAFGYSTGQIIEVGGGFGIQRL